MKTATKQQSDQNVLAVLHQTGRVWRGVIARLSGNGRGGRNGDQDAPAMLAHREFTVDQLAQIDDWLDEHQAGEVIGVLHASSVICRTCTLPNASEEQLVPALRLQAESHLLGIAPPHRVGMSVIEAAAGETTRIGLVLAWPNSSSERTAATPTGTSEIEKSSLLPVRGRKTMFAPDVAGLAALLNGHRPTQPILWVDRADGSCAVAMTHANGAVFRALREDEQDPEQWKQSIGRALAETALNVGHSSSFIEAMVRLTHERMDVVASDEAALFVPDEVMAAAANRFESAPMDADWWNRYGIAAGVILARSGKLADLTRMLEEEPQEKPSALRTAVEVLSRPATAKFAVVACLLILLFGPLAMSALRLSILQMQYDRVADQLDAIQQTENKLVVYRHLSSDAWPMTKVLADIASCTPEGIELESINVRQQRTFTLSGRAIPFGDRTAPEVVELMREQLRATGIFTDITLNWGQGDAYGNYEFGLNARLHRPYHQFNYPEDQDFALETLAERRDRRDGLIPAARGDDAAPTEVARGDVDRAERTQEPARDERADTRSPGRTVTPPPLDRGSLFAGDAANPRDDRGAGGVRPSENIPPPLSEGEIRSMSQSEVSDMLVKISGARRIARRGNDQELIDRLQREFDLLMERMREAAEP